MIIQDTVDTHCQCFDGQLQYHERCKGRRRDIDSRENPNLMDISGDTVHMINNVAKTLLSLVDYSI